MPFKSSTSNVYNPRAHRYFHSNGSTDARLTQPPTILSLPPLPAKPTVSVINLFELSKRYEEGMIDTSEFYINEYLNRAIDRLNNSNSNQPVNNLKNNNETINDDVSYLDQEMEKLIMKDTTEINNNSRQLNDDKTLKEEN